MLVLVIGLGSYQAAIGSDPYGLIHFARDLSRGIFFSDFPVYGYVKTDWEPGISYFVLGGNYVAAEGRMYCKYEVGYPLLLAAAIVLFGNDAVYLFNGIILVLILGSYFAFVRDVYDNRPGNRYLALFSLFLLCILADKIWGLAVKPVRDLSSMLFLITGFWLLIRSLKRSPRLRLPCLLAGSFALGFSASIRLPNILALLPAVVYLLTRLAGRVNWKKGLIVVLLAALGCGIGVAPVLVQNKLARGTAMIPPRPGVIQENGEEEGNEEGTPDPENMTGEKDSPPAARLFGAVYRSFFTFGAEKPPSPLWVGFLRTTGRDTMKYFFGIYGLALTALGLLGLVTGWKRPAVRYICLGMPIIFIVFYSMWVHLMDRYMVVAHPFLIILIAGGIGRLFEFRSSKWILWFGPLLIGADIFFRWMLNREYGLGVTDLFALAVLVGIWLVAAREPIRGLKFLRYPILCIILFGIFVCRMLPYRLAARETFQLPQAHRFGEAIDRVAPAGSVIFATKPVTQLISLFSGSDSIRSFEIERLGVSLVDGGGRILDRGVPLFLFDSSGGRRDGSKYVPLLRKYFDVTTAAELRAADYHLSHEFGRPVCTLYRIERWNRKEVDLDIAGLKEGEDYLMTLNARTIWADYPDRSRVEVLLNGRPLDVALKDNINYLFLPARLLRNPDSILTIKSDQPLPRMMDFSVQSVWSPYTIIFGERAKVPEYFLLSGFERFHWQDKYFYRLLWEKTGEVMIPTILLPDTELIGEIDLRNGQKVKRPVGLRIGLGKKEITDLDLSWVSNWDTIRFPIPDDAVSGSAGSLRLTAYPLAGYRIPYPDDTWWGALSIKAVTVRRWLRRAWLETPSAGYCFVAFEIIPPPGVDNCGEPYRVLVSGRAVRDDLRGAVQRLLLDPGQVSAPVTGLTVESAASGCPALLRTRPVVARPGEDLDIDIGGEDDWAYLAEGFSKPELFLDKGEGRWTSGTAVLEVPLFSGSGHGAALVLEILDSPPAGIPPEERKCAVYLDGKQIGVISLRPGGGTYRQALPLPDLPARLAKIELFVPLWSPSSYYETADKRLLGIMLDRVKIEYR